MSDEIERAKKDWEDGALKECATGAQRALSDRLGNSSQPRLPAA